jgi:hypothetical protein
MALPADYYRLRLPRLTGLSWPIVSGRPAKQQARNMDRQNSDDWIPTNKLPAKTVKASVNARMLETIQSNPAANCWNSTQWAKYLLCTRTSVVNTDTWVFLKGAREEEKARKMKETWQRRINRSGSI